MTRNRTPVTNLLTDEELAMQAAVTPRPRAPVRDDEDLAVVLESTLRSHRRGGQLTPVEMAMVDAVRRDDERRLDEIRRDRLAELRRTEEARAADQARLAEQRRERQRLARLVYDNDIARARRKRATRGEP